MSSVMATEWRADESFSQKAIAFNSPMDPGTVLHRKPTMDGLLAVRSRRPS
jgi:hypothetical protein